MGRRWGALVGGAAFTVWSAAVLTPAMDAADLAITRGIQRLADGAALDVALSLLTRAANIEVTAVLVLILSLVLWRAGAWRAALVLGAVLLAGTAIEEIAKHALPHPPPAAALRRAGIPVLHAAIRAPYNYPSGHAFRTLLVASAVWAILAPAARHLRTLLRGALVAVVPLMAVALVYLGHHWASEVVGGCLLGWTGATLVRAAMPEPVSRR